VTQSEDLALYVEEVRGEGRLVHALDLPGFSHRGGPKESLDSAEMRSALSDYGTWLRSSKLAELTAATARLCRDRVPGSSLCLVEAERRAGAPVWQSGNAAVLFRIEERALSLEETEARLRFARAVLDAIERLVAGREVRLTPPKRTVPQTLEHVGNCIWWYASRLDDRLPEPEDLADEDGISRCLRLFGRASRFLLDMPLAERTRVVIPRRYPTRVPSEPWTHAKACRREAEHLWDHYRSLRRDLGN
jgi:hypothetical protein